MRCWPPDDGAGSWRGFISNNARDKKHEIFLKNNKKWIKGNRNNLSCADVQKQKMAALQSGFIKTKLQWRRITQSPICEHRALSIWWTIRCISFHKNYIIKGTVSKFPLFWLTHPRPCKLDEKTKRKKYIYMYIADSLLNSKDCVHVSASLRGYTAAEGLESPLPFCSVRKDERDK